MDGKVCIKLSSGGKALATCLEVAWVRELAAVLLGMCLQMVLDRKLLVAAIKLALHQPINQPAEPVHA